ncbi:MAG: Ig domain-containing protein [Verrucomicrobiae bacterium]|nr:Ig domain-containing protein [Verrucomicrobiae bacterium]
MGKDNCNCSPSGKGTPLQFKLGKHAEEHLACGCDPIPWDKVHGWGEKKDLPEPSKCNKGYFFLVLEDGKLPLLYLSDGEKWIPVNPLNNLDPNIPVITSPNQISGPVNQALVYQITATNDPDKFGAVNIPPGMAFNADTGVISGVPNTPGVWGVQLSATNSYGTGVGVVLITITGGNDAPVIQPPVNAGGKVGSPFGFGMTATGGSPITFTFLDPLPPGLAGDASGLILGVPSQKGIFIVNVQADSPFGSDQKAIAITIEEGQQLFGLCIWILPPPPAVNSPGDIGMRSFDPNYSYECIAPNLWRRKPHTTW